MINYQQRAYWKGSLFVFAILISIGSLLYTRFIVREIKKEEYKMISLFAEALREINNSLFEENPPDISFYFHIIETNESIPVILADTNDNILEFRNIDSAKVLIPGYLTRQFNIMKKQHEPIEINYMAGKKHLVYYKNSRLISDLTIYPWLQLLLVVMFIIVAYFAFNSSRRFEQNKVWIGMSKETAHQLGTPVSSLMAIAESIKDNNQGINSEFINELEKDVKRLEIITDRFSKIGSVPKPEHLIVYDVLNSTIEYLKPRFSRKVQIGFTRRTDHSIKAWIIPTLFDWVIENLCKNAINAMEGSGKIEFSIATTAKYVYIDVSDTGHGIPRSKHTTVFKAGFTTSRGGWGLGLSLSKRIIEDYHRGKIYIKSSEPGKGTTFRIRLLR